MESKITKPAWPNIQKGISHPKDIRRKYPNSTSPGNNASRKK